MYKGYRNHLFCKDRTNKSIKDLAHINRCSKCKKLNPSIIPPVIMGNYVIPNNEQRCLYCGNPFYIIRVGVM